MFVGWGGKQQIWRMSPTAQVLMNYRYYHMMWVIWLAHHITYQWLFTTPQGMMTRPVTPEEMVQYQINDHLKINWWLHYSLFLFLGVVGVFCVTMTVLSLAGALS